MSGGSRFLTLALLLFLASCAGKVEGPVYQKASFGDLKGWGADRQALALPAFEKSCKVLVKKEALWDGVCAAAKKTAKTDAAARAFFENHFDVYALRGDGLFTGYYEAQLNGARTQGGAFQTPLWQRPMNLITADLGDFSQDLKGKKIAGKVVGQKLKPYEDRAAIVAGALPGEPPVAEPLVWVDDPVGAFFLEIQGSGRVKLEDGTEMRVGYDAQNGHAYVPVGRSMADEGLIQKPVSMQKIRDWMKKNPARAQSVMNRNPSVIFFREISGDGPLGAQGITLTPERSLAVDPAFVPLGAPVWIDARDEKIERLVIAQDTGGAIKGAVRGDLFWGAGKTAEERAGKMQSGGAAFLLWPKGAKLP